MFLCLFHDSNWKVEEVTSKLEMNLTIDQIKTTGRGSEENREWGEGVREWGSEGVREWGKERGRDEESEKLLILRKKEIVSEE